MKTIQRYFLELGEAVCGLKQIKQRPAILAQVAQIFMNCRQISELFALRVRSFYYLVNPYLRSSVYVEMVFSRVWEAD